MDLKNEVLDHAETIEGMVSREDCDLIWDNAMKSLTPGGFAIEIGGWKGKSTYVIARACQEKGATLYELDTFKGVEDPNSRKNQPGNLGGYWEATMNPNFKNFMLSQIAGLPVLILEGDSKLTIHKIPDKSVDYAFIDGNHDAPFVDADIKNTIQKMKLGGLLTGHDHGNPDTDVHGAVDRIFGKDFYIETRTNKFGTAYCLTQWHHVIKEEDYAKV